MAPLNKTAILVIHGIGEQNPFDTLDSFARGLKEHYREQGIELKMQHFMEPRVSSSGGVWTESYIRLSPETGENYVDIHEYYWAHLTEEVISFGEIMQWLRKTLEGAKYSFEKYKKDFGLSRKGWRNYWWRLNSIIWHVRIFLWMARLALFITNVLGFALPWFGTIRKWSEKARGLATPIVVGYIGDIAIYTTIDQKSRHFNLRKQIIAEALAMLKAILAQKDGDQAAYDRVIVAGHSLGSAIAYDTIARLNLDASLRGAEVLPLDKISALVTFGSPLDKIAFFFREHVGKEQYIRRQILDLMHSFRSRWSEVEVEPAKRLLPGTKVDDNVADLRWLNFFDRNDPISGRLEFYTKVENHELKVPGKWPVKGGEKTRARWGVAHTKYWDDPGFYAILVRHLFSSAPSL